MALGGAHSNHGPATSPHSAIKNKKMAGRRGRLPALRLSRSHSLSQRSMHNTPDGEGCTIHRRSCARKHKLPNLCSGSGGLWGQPAGLPPHGTIECGPVPRVSNSFPRLPCTWSHRKIRYKILFRASLKQTMADSELEWSLAALSVADDVLRSPPPPLAYLRAPHRRVPSPRCYKSTRR